jgi:hypothetical protein
MNRLSWVAVLTFVLAGVLLGSNSTVFADKAKPSVSMIKITKHIDVSTPTLGRVQLMVGLHLASQVALDGGLATNFELSANLFDSHSTNADGLKFIAVGADRDAYTPAAPCNPTGSCQPPTWTFKFVLIPPSPPVGPLPVPYPNTFTLHVATTYDAEGKLQSADIVTDILE